MNTSIKLLNKEDWSDEIKLLYQSDVVHTILHHIKSGEGVDECVKYTIGVLKETNNVSLYKVLDCGGKKIGLFSFERLNNINVVAFWFIDVESRKADKIKEYWSAIKEFTGDVFYTSANKKNDKAISHLLKNGFTEIYKLLDNQLIFKS